MTFAEQLKKMLRSRKFWVLVAALVATLAAFLTQDRRLAALQAAVAALAVYSTGVAIEDGTVEPKNSPDALLKDLAAHLAKPFLLPGHSGQPLSLRCLPDGGMVVIAPDGRKLWFTAREVGTARHKLNMPA